MDNPAAMRRVKRIGNLDGPKHGLLGRHSSGPEERIQSLAFEILQNQIVAPAVSAHVVERADVRVIDVSQNPRFTLQSLQEPRLALNGFVQELDCYRSSQPVVVRVVNPSHGARADAALQAVRPQLLTLQSHGIEVYRRFFTPFLPS